MQKSFPMPQYLTFVCQNSRKPVPFLSNFSGLFEILIIPKASQKHEIFENSFFRLFRFFVHSRNPNNPGISPICTIKFKIQFLIKSTYIPT